MLTAMFAKFPNLPGTDRSGSPEANEAGEGEGQTPRDLVRNLAGHGVRSLDWHSLRAKLSAERDLRGAMRGENEAMASWIRAEGSFDPRAAEALFGHAHGDHGGVFAPVHEAPGGPVCRADNKNSGFAGPCLPDPKPSQTNDVSGCSMPTSGGGSASGLNIED